MSLRDANNISDIAVANRLCFLEIATHGMHIPFLDRLIERRYIMKQVAPIGDVAHVPLANRLIEHCRCEEHATHISNSASVPVTDRLVERPSVMERVGICHPRLYQ
jgi:hypothetical protein